MLVQLKNQLFGLINLIRGVFMFKLVKLFDKAGLFAQDEIILKFYKDDKGNWDLVETNKAVYDLEVIQ